jgi:hypothetical protein
MVRDRIEPRLAVTSAAAALAFLSAAVAFGLATMAIIRDTSMSVISPSILLAASAAAAAIVIGRHIDFSKIDADTIAASMRLGILSAVGAIAILVVSENLLDRNGIGRLDFVALVVISILVIASGPIVTWLTTSRRFERLVGTTASNVAATAVQPSPPWRRTDTLLVLAIMAVLFAGLLMVLSPGPLGHDESVYALKARSWVSGTPTTGWGLHRPIGMPIIGWFVLQFSETETAFRSAGIAMAVATIGAMWTVGRTMFDRWPATIGVGVFISSASFLRRSTEFLNDIAAAGLLLVTMAVIWHHFERKPGGWTLLAAAPVTAVAYYLRYGSAVGFVIIAVVAAIIWRKALVTSWRSILATAGLLLSLLVPHFVYARSETGSALGVFQRAGSAVGGDTWGLSDYYDWLPSKLAGTTGAILIVAAAIYFVVVLTMATTGTRSSGEEARKVAFLVSTAVVLTLILGSRFHAEPRFVFLPLMATLLVGAQAVVRTSRVLGRIPLRVLGSAAIVGLVIAFVAGITPMSEHMDDLSVVKNVIVDTSDIIVVDAAGSDCVIRSSFTPQLTWYTGCATYRFVDPLPEIDPAYLVVFENGKRQPTGSELEHEIAATDGLIGLARDAVDWIGDGRVYRYAIDR